MTSDSKGHGHSEGYALIKNTLMTTYTSVLKYFFNFNHSKTVKTIVVDKDISKIGVIRKVYPHANIVLCSFHVIRAREGAIQTHCRQMSETEKAKISKLVHTMVYCESVDKFNDAFSQIPVQRDHFATI